MQDFTLKRFAMISLILAFYVGFNIIGLGIGMVKGDVTHLGQIIEAVNPVSTLRYYNTWFIESYEQFNDSTELASRNSLMGMIMSGFAIILPYIVVFSIITSSIKGETIRDYLIIATVLIIPFALIGGLDGFITVWYKHFGVGWEIINI